MAFSTLEAGSPTAVGVEITEDSLKVDLQDGRALFVPLVWYPRLVHATPEERGKWRLIGGGRGIHWEDVDEDISIDNMLAGKGSAESQGSLKRWLAGRAK